MSIHSTAVVASGAELHPSVEVGPYAVIGANVQLAEGVVVGPHAVIDGHTTIGKGTRISPFASVGSVPQDLKFKGEITRLEIGEFNQIREFTTISVGTGHGGGLTKIGNRCLLMANSHVAHDCQVGNGVILANSVALAGHVEVEDFVICGGLAAVHQFTRIGKHAFLSGGALVGMDVPPYCIAQSGKAELAGLNTEGLSRHGFDEKRISAIKSAYRTMFRAGLGLHEALAKVKAEHPGDADVEHFVKFIEGSKRGVTR